MATKTVQNECGEQITVTVEEMVEITHSDIPDEIFSFELKEVLSAPSAETQKTLIAKAVFGKGFIINADEVELIAETIFALCP